MIKQTVSYGVWTINRHDDNKIEVLKNGQVCEKSTPALREIAAGHLAETGGRNHLGTDFLYL